MAPAGHLNNTHSEIIPSKLLAGNEWKKGEGTRSDLRALLDLTDWAYFSLDSSGLLIEVSDCLAQLLATTPDAIVGMPLASLCTPPHASLLSEHLVQLAASGTGRVKAGRLHLFLAMKSPSVHHPCPIPVELVALLPTDKSSKEIYQQAVTRRTTANTPGAEVTIIGLIRPIAPDLSAPNAKYPSTPGETDEETTRLAEASRRHAQQLQAVIQMGQRVANFEDLDALLNYLVTLLHQEFHYPYADVFLLDEDETQLTLRASTSLVNGSSANHSPAAQGRVRIRIGERGVIGMVAGSGESTLITDVASYSDCVPFSDRPDVKSVLALPFTTAGRVVGVLSVQSDRPDAFALDDVMLLQIMSNYAAIAIENAALLEERDQRIAELVALNQIGLLLASPRPLIDILDAIIRRVGALFQVEAGSLILIEDGRLRFKVASGTRIDQIEPYTLEIGEGIAGWAVEHNQTARVNDVSADARHYSGIDQAIGFDTRSLIAAPLRIALPSRGTDEAKGEERVLGVVEIINRLDGRSFTRNDEVLLEFIASSAAVVIENARLHEETSRRLAEVSTLYTLANQVTTVLDLDRILESTVIIINHALDCQGACLHLRDTQTGDLTLKASSGWRLREVEAADLQFVSSICRRVLRERRPVNLSDTDSEKAGEEQGSSIRSLLVVPLITKNDLIGTLSIDSQTPRAFGPGEGRLLTIAAAQVSVAIENARLLANLRNRAVQLEQTLAELRELNRLKTEFVQNVSHELRTPLTFIKGYVQLILEGAMDDSSRDLQQALTIVSQRTDVMVRLVNDIISLEQVETGRIEFQPTSLAEVATNAVEGAAMAVKKANLNIELRVADELPLVHADPVRLGQVFDNLLGNAIKFSPDGGIIKVRVLRDGNFARADVEDQGIGIPADKLDRIFDRFYQVDGSTTRRYGGTGLGLAIVKTIVESHGGQVIVESQVESGSIFSFILPIPADD